MNPGRHRGPKAVAIDAHPKVMDCFALLAMTRVFHVNCHCVIAAPNDESIPSFPRRRESSAFWIPAFAGMTTVCFTLT